eukprot:5522837-Prorocentrum_lima.AAC.1
MRAMPRIFTHPGGQGCSCSLRSYGVRGAAGLSTCCGPVRGGLLPSCSCGWSGSPIHSAAW